MLSKVEMLKRHASLQLTACPECGDKELVTDKGSGEVACSKCGLVLTDHMLDHKPEWRAFTIEEKAAKIRIGPPTSILRHDKGLSTSFKPYRDLSGRLLSPEIRAKMIRLRKWNRRERLHSSKERNLSQAMTRLNLLADKLHIPTSIKEEAALIYRKALNQDLVRGRSITALVVASLYLGCRLTGTPRCITDMVKASSIDRKEITRCYRLVQRELGLKMPIDDPVNCVSRIASRTGLSQRTQNHATHILREARRRGAIMGKNPYGIAAAALYIAASHNAEKITQKDLASAAQVTEVTVRNRYKQLVKDLKLTKA